MKTSEVDVALPFDVPVDLPFNPDTRPEFSGPVYDEAKDRIRLTGQILRIFELMRDGQWRTVSEIHEALPQDPENSIQAQLRHLRKARFGRHEVSKRRRGGDTSALWEYRIGAEE